VRRSVGAAASGTGGTGGRQGFKLDLDGGDVIGTARGGLEPESAGGQTNWVGPGDRALPAAV